MALIEATREETMELKVKTVMVSGYSRDRATNALMLVSTANEAINCLQNPEKLEQIQRLSVDGQNHRAAETTSHCNLWV